MPILYTDTRGEKRVAYIAPGITPAEAAREMHLAPGWREITDAEAAALFAPTPEEQQKALQDAFTNAIQAHLDTFARTRNYDGIFSAATYATSTVPQFKAEGQYAVEARDIIWATAYGILTDVRTGVRPMPTIEDVLAELPPLAWP